jgi:eukaryotic-like serine/threonine-protein kinase
MMPDLGQRLTVALDEMQALGPHEVERYLHALRASDPELAGRLRALLNVPPADAAGAASRGAERNSSVVPLGAVCDSPLVLGEPTVSADAPPTASFAPPAPAPANSPEPPRGPILNRYQLLHAVGRGAFGDVWKAFDPILDKHVAVKVSRPDRSLPVAAFLDEARKAASLRHPAIVHVYDVGADPDGWYIVSEFIDGTSLRDRAAAGRVPAEQTARIAATVAGALHAAHLAGLVHRDVKPGNILLDRAGNAYLTDFGLAVREEDQFAERSKVFGTLAYMPPEQISGDTHLLDGRADIYALGAVLYELLTGRPLFRAADIDEYRELILRREPRPLRSIDATVPAELERVCLKCLAKEVKDRYHTAQDVAAELEAWLAGSTRSAVAPAPPTPVRDRWKLVAGVVLAVAVVAGAIVLATREGKQPALAGKDEPPAPAKVEPRPAPVEPPTVAVRKVPAVRPLIWTDKDGVNRWDVVPAGDRLTVYTESTALLRLGETTAKDWTFTVTLRQLASAGQIGLFVGHRKDATTALGSCEVIQFTVFKGELWLQRYIYRYPLDKPFTALQPMPVGHAQLGTVPSDRTLRLSIEGGRLSEVRVNGAPVPAIFKDPKHRPDADGEYGVFNYKSDGVFSYPQYNDKPIPLFEPLPATPERP